MSSLELVNGEHIYFLLQWPKRYMSTISMYLPRWYIFLIILYYGRLHIEYCKVLCCWYYVSPSYNNISLFYQKFDDAGSVYMIKYTTDFLNQEKLFRNSLELRTFWNLFFHENKMKLWWSSPTFTACDEKAFIQSSSDTHLGVYIREQITGYICQMQLVYVCFWVDPAFVLVSWW
jgi:hypothetical protein